MAPWKWKTSQTHGPSTFKPGPAILCHGDFFLQRPYECCIFDAQLCRGVHFQVFQSSCCVCGWRIWKYIYISRIYIYNIHHSIKWFDLKNPPIFSQIYGGPGCIRVFHRIEGCRILDWDCMLYIEVNYLTILWNLTIFCAAVFSLNFNPVMLLAVNVNWLQIEDKSTTHIQKV